MTRSLRVNVLRHSAAVAIFEMFKIDKEMQGVILKNPTQGEIYKIARKKGC